MGKVVRVNDVVDRYRRIAKECKVESLGGGKNAKMTRNDPTNLTSVQALQHQYQLANNNGNNNMTITNSNNNVKNRTDNN